MTREEAERLLSKYTNAVIEHEDAIGEEYQHDCYVNMEDIKNKLLSALTQEPVQTCPDGPGKYLMTVPVFVREPTIQSLFAERGWWVEIPYTNMWLREALEAGATFRKTGD